MSDLLKAAADSPLLLTFLVVLGGGVWAVEKLGGVNGPISRAVRAWQERELRRLERERLVDARRRDLDATRTAELRDEVRWLRERLAYVEGRAGPPTVRRPVVHPIPAPRRHDPATAPIPRRNSARAEPADR